MARLHIPFQHSNSVESTPKKSFRPPTVCSSSMGMEYGQIALSKVSFPVAPVPVSSPETNVESFPRMTSLCSLQSLFPLTIFRRTHRGRLYPFHSLLLTRCVPCRRIKGLVSNCSDPIVAAQPANELDIVFIADATALQPVDEPEDDAENDMSLIPVLRREPSTAQESDSPIDPALNAQTSLASPQESVLLHYSHHKRPIHSATGADASNQVSRQLTRQMWLPQD